MQKLAVTIKKLYKIKWEKQVFTLKGTKNTYYYSSSKLYHKTKDSALSFWFLLQGPLKRENIGLSFILISRRSNMLLFLFKKKSLKNRHFLWNDTFVVDLNYILQYITEIIYNKKTKYLSEKDSILFES